MQPGDGAAGRAWVNNEAMGPECAIVSEMYFPLMTRGGGVAPEPKLDYYRERGS